jgi:hypothetical protein
MRQRLLGMVVATGLLSSPAYCDLFTSVQVTASADSDPYGLPGNVRVTNSCFSASGFCGLNVTSGQFTGQVSVELGANYGSVSSHYAAYLWGDWGEDGWNQGSLSAGFTDDITLYGHPDYAYVQVTVSGTAGWFHAVGGGPSPAPSPNLIIGSDVITLDMPWGNGNPFTVTTPLLALPGNEFELGITLNSTWALPFEHPAGLSDVEANIRTIQFFDHNQDAISEVFYTDNSGTPYSITGGQMVPEPSSVVLLLTVLVGTFKVLSRLKVARRGAGLPF